ncbi:CIA30 family protein [Pseudomonadota bacterium]
MKSLNILAHIAPRTIAAVICVATFNFAVAGTLDPTIDDFSDPKNNSLGFERQFVDDTVAGGQTRMEHGFEKGVFSAKGEISPPRGQPGWASTVLLLETQGLPQDASVYEGIRLLVRVNKGKLSISANSSEITNFDYHAAQVTRQSDGEFHEVMIPFTDMKRAWSEQTKLNTKTLTSLSIVAFDIQQGSFDFEIDEVSFY